MSCITAHSYGNAGTHTIAVKNKDYFWVKMKDIQDKLELKNIPQQVRLELCGKYETNDLSEEQKQKYIKSEYQITKVSTDNKRDKYARNDRIEKIIKNCRRVKKCNDGMNKMQKEDKRQKFWSLLGFKEHVFESKENSMIEKIQTVFSAEKILLEHSVFTYRIDLYFPKHRLAVEIDEQNHENRNINYEIQRQKAIEKELKFEFIRINLDNENFDVFVKISKIQNHFIESTKKNVIDDALNELIKLKSKKFDSIKRKCLKYIVQKVLPNL